MAPEGAWVYLLRWLARLVYWLQRLLQNETAGRQPPPGYEQLWKTTLKNDGAIYQESLRLFYVWCKAEGIVLDAASDVDAAASRYLGTLSRARGNHLLAALLNAHPPLRYRMPWAFAVLKCQAALRSPEHHAPMTWRLALGIASVLSRMGRRKDGALLLLQWRLGLRPSEAQQLLAAHLWVPAERRQCGTARVGVRHGAKVRHTQFVRIYPGDSVTWFLVARVLACRQPHEPVGLWRSPASQTAWLRKACCALRLPGHWTSHSPRAGWATARHVAGQPTADLVADGRWASASTLRGYLDAVGALQAEAEVTTLLLDEWLDERERESLLLGVVEFLS